MRGLWSISPKDIWAVGDLGLIMHFDGTAWTTTTGVTTKDLTAVWASSATDVWAVGDSGTIARWDAEGYAPIRMAVNVAVPQLRQGDFVAGGQRDRAVKAGHLL